MEESIDGRNQADPHSLLWLGIATALIILAAFAYQWLAR
jgi:hypothetical protein